MMRSMLALLLMVLLFPPAPSAGQQPGSTKEEPATEVSSADPTPQRRPRPPGEEDDPIRRDMEKRRQKAFNKERFEELKRDTGKLLELATELKTHVEKADENMLSLDVLKKAEQIEKLAKSVKEKMKAY